MYQTLEECPVCGHTHFSNHLICKDYAASQESFALVRCTKCNLIFTNPRPDEDKIASYYSHENYISHTNRANNLTNLAYKVARHFTLRSKFRLIKKYTSKTRLLDFGCGTGTFISYLQKKGFDVTGYEPSPEANQVASHLTHTEILTSLPQLKKQEKFDIITAWHVIEHVHDLKATIKTLRKALTKKGLLILALPNINSLDAKYYGTHWAALDVPRHLYHFDKHSVELLAKKRKLNLIATHPMLLDAYYVSILSEGYITGKPNYIRALKQGYHSNSNAKKTGEYSSLIYILTK